ncbi:hypothetical protein CPB84DRAFT_1746871 [Gymnopilus junonius]|uniref:Uncharacterized protein n=1 Tax=Gymnopilus junonius TaxID=109634 RepID=A0A9P5NP32_GYMJU|nr:hypothetical protein CPB84DRAFT_1746871 [Gymnopilus junonius]
MNGEVTVPSLKSTSSIFTEMHQILYEEVELPPASKYSLPGRLVGGIVSRKARLLIFLNPTSICPSIRNLLAMPATNEPEREMTELSTVPQTIRGSHDARSSRSQGGSGHQSTHHRPHDDSQRQILRKPVTGDRDHGSKRSNDDREAEGNESNSRRRPAPSVPDKQSHQHTKRSDSTDRRRDRERERERSSRDPERTEQPRERPRAESVSSTSSASLSSFEYLARPGLQYQEDQDAQEKGGRTSHPSSRSSTKDDSRPPQGPEQSNTTSRQSRSQQPSSKPGDPRSSPDIAKHSSAQPSPTKGTSQPPQVPNDSRPSATMSYAKVTATAPPQTSTTTTSRDRIPGPTTEGEDAANFSSLPLNTQLPEGLEGLGIDPAEQIQALQQIEQAHVAEHVAAQQQLQQGEARDQSNILGGYSVIAGAFRNLSGALAPPRDREWQRAMNEIHHLRSELKYVKDEYRGCRHAYHEAHAERLRLRESVGGLQHELSNVYKELEETKNLSEIRGRELVGAQVFLTKADSLSVSDVCEKIMVLNEEIFQAAASLGETLTKTKRNMTEADMKKHYERSCGFVGEPMVNLLLDQARRQDPDVNMLIVQAALSVFLVGFCVTKLLPWHLNDKAIDGFLGNLYTEIRASEEQAVTGRWRALTRSKMRITSGTWRAEIVDSLKSVLVIAEWGSPSPKDQEVSFLQKLPPIFKAIEDVRIALGEKFTSADLEVNVVRTTAKFDGKWMEDAYGDGREAGGKKAKEEMVVGTTGIGLKKVVIDRERGFPLKGQEMFENVVSPKVVLESTLRESLDPPPPTRGKGRRKKVEEEVPPAGQNNN